MYEATFIFRSNAPINRIISELINETENYERIRVMDNNEAPFQIEYEFSEEHNGTCIAIGTGGIDSDDGEFGYE